MYKILIADDEQLERKALKLTIQQKMPFLQVVAEAKNGDEAIELARHFTPDMMLLDIKMPGRTGLEAAQEIIRLNPETKIIIITAFDFFEYAKKALQIGTYDYLLKPVRPNELLAVLQKCVDDVEEQRRAKKEEQKLKEQLEQTWPYIEASFIYDLVNGNIVGEKEGKRRANALGIHLSPANVMVVAIENGDLTNYSTEFHSQLIRQKVFEVLKSNFKDHSSVLMAPIMDQKFVLLIPCTDDFEAKTRSDYCRHIGEKIIQELAEIDILVSIGIGNCYQDVFMVQQSYLEALVSQRCSSFAGGNKIISCIDCQEKECVINLPADQNQKVTELIGFICSGDWENSKEILDILWKTICTSNVGEELQKACALELLVVFYRAAMKSSNRQQLSVLDLSNVTKLMNSRTIQELCDQWYEAVREIIELVQAGKEESLGSVINAVKGFIQENFSKDITLNDAARHVHISPCYLSRIFSKEEGLPFNKYLTNVKLNHARHLLLSTNQPINEIASAAGYQDVSYFCRVFKQNEGISPNQYRQSD